MNKLPDELVAYTIAFLIRDYTSGFIAYSDMRDYHRYNRLDMMLVCHQWYRVIVDTPRYWSTICIPPDHIQDRDSLVRKSLALSKSAPLNILLNLTPGADPYGDSHSEVPRALEHIPAHQDRVQLLGILVAFRYDLELVLKVLRPNFPMLKKMDLAIGFDRPDLTAFYFPALELSFLQDLRLCNISSLKWHSLSTPNLRKLVVEPGQCEFQIDSFFRFLCTTPLLEHLEVCGVNLPSDCTSSHQTDLLYLKTLKISHGWHGDMAHQLLLHINAVNLQVLYISSLVESSPGITFINHFSHLIQLFLVGIEPTPELLPRLAEQMPNLRSLMLVTSADVPPIDLQFFGHRQENGQLYFPHLNTLILQHFQMPQIVDLVRNRRETLLELLLYPRDFYIPWSIPSLETEWAWLRSAVRVIIRCDQIEGNHDDDDDPSRRILLDADSVGPNLDGCETVCIDGYLEGIHGMTT